MVHEMYAEKSSLNLSIIHRKSGGSIEKNPALKPYLNLCTDFKTIANYSRRGTPLIKFGKGKPSLMLTAGVHGNEIPPQLAALNLIKFLKTLTIRGTVYIIPFVAPMATMKNSRWFMGDDLNRVSHVVGSITNIILELALNWGVDALADFHSTAPGSKPGVEGVFCSRIPEPKSMEIAEYIVSRTSSEVLCYDRASLNYQGALEDECNLSGVPAVTCEVVSENGVIRQGSMERSLMQMKTFLEFFHIGV